MLRELPKKVAAGDEIEVQLAPLGEWPNTVGDKTVVQRFDEAALHEVVGNYSGEILVDCDHSSVRPGGDTRAYAWVTALRADPALGLVGTFRLTDAGADAVNSREYRFVSVAWFLDADGRPERLDSVALTNRPNLPVRPVLNRAPGATANAAGGGTTERNPEMDMKKLAAALGLPETATEDEILAAISAKDEEIAKARTDKADAEAEAFAENAVKGGKIAANAKDAVKAAYLRSPETAQEMLNSIAAPKPAAAPSVPDFARAKAPRALNAATPGAGSDPVAVYNAYMAMAEGPGKDAYLAANAQAISDGYEAVRNVR